LARKRRYLSPRAKTSALWWLRSFVLHPHAPGLSHFVARRLE
jgi:hypothetical protein